MYKDEGGNAVDSGTGPDVLGINKEDDDPKSSNEG
jgi:hypothetical protein